MGAYLSTPIREKISDDGDSRSHRFGASSMQGWRVSQEDAHNCIPDFDGETSTSLYAVYDGHGGPEIAQYSEMNFPNYLKNLKEYKEEKLSKALEVAFLKFDAHLIQEDIMKELKEIAGVNPDEDDEEDEEAEAAALVEEATMPIEMLMERYSHLRKGTNNNNKFQSPLLRCKKGDTANNNEDEVPIEADVKISLDSKLSNGHVHDDENKDTKNDSSHNSNPIPDSDCRTSSVEGLSSSDQKNSENETTSPKENCDIKDSSDILSSENTKDETNKTVSNDGCSSSSSSDPMPGSSSGNARKKRDSSTNNDDDDESDSEDNSDEEKDWASDDDEEILSEDEEDDEEDDEEKEDFVHPPQMEGAEEPGMDSGCTAVVCLLRGSQLVVANAGDSRCVVCRDGKAIDMSIDHKPEDELERNRIEKAGGRVTLDGRVNGGLNLSRAIGDHCYKMNKELPDTEQMITALPDVRHLSLNDKDEFMILACDGIWNVMTSQEAVNFVCEEIKSGNQNLSQICEQLFDFCLAPNTEGDGTGCDNMTCIIVAFKNIEPQTNKRSAESEDTTDDSSNKRSKICKNGIE